MQARIIITALLALIFICTVSCKKEKCWECKQEMWTNASPSYSTSTETVCDESSKNFREERQDTAWSSDHKSWIYIRTKCNKK